MDSSSERPPVRRNSATRATSLPILRRSHHLLAGPQAHPHLAIHAAGMLGRRRQILLAAPHLKQVQKLRFETLGRSARAERAEVQAARCASDEW